MTIEQETLSDALLRKFLLGKVHDEERARIEDLFLVHPETKQRVLEAEHDLTEDYLENSLTPADREIFVSVYVRTAKQRQNLRIMQLIKECAASEARLANARSGNSLRERLSLRPILLLPICLAIAIVIVLVIGWSNRTRQDRLAVERELAQLNAPASLREVSPQVISLELPPVTLRSAGGRVELNKGAGVQLVELRLPWFQKESFSACEAEIRRVGEDESFTIRYVLLEGEGKFAARIRLPARLLRSGHYQIRLRGIAANGETGLTEEYQFIVRG